MKKLTKGANHMFYITKQMHIALFAIMLIGGLVAVANSQTQGAAEMKGLKVTVFLFSGRPDPSYVIDDAASLDQIKKIFETSKETRFEKSTVIPSILGYKGIAAENTGNIPGIPQNFAVYKGTIEVGTKEKKFLTDEGNALEKLLFDKAVERGVIEENILKRIKEGEKKQ
jgi:hypothetical protein